MKKISFVFYFFVFLFFNAFSQMTEEQRKNLFNKVLKKFDIMNPNDFIGTLNGFFREKFTYDPDKIKKIIADYHFPETYDFFEDKKVQKHIKDQKNCGCCWAFASSSALGYRYSRDRDDVNLSPQNILSCYIRDCEEGGPILDPQFYLIENGTTTESCVPYSSSDGKTIESCHNKCNGDEEFKKYYAKNSYATSFDFFDSETYHDVVTIIMDQLVNYGPVAAGINCYKDFQEFGYKSNCKSSIYKYDGKSEYISGHAVVIVGYGNEGSKYYWIIQNSWGENYCDGGFAKIEFNEINIENVAFSEPYIETEMPKDKKISVVMKLEEDCKISYTTDSNNYDINFALNFKSQDSQNNFYYQCGKNNIINGKGGVCLFSYKSFNQNDRGYYQYNYHSPIRSTNQIDLDFSSFDKNGFNFYALDAISSLNDDYYVSGEGSEITLKYTGWLNNRNLKAKIYLSENSQNFLTNCKLSETEINGNIYLLKCKLTQNEVDFIGENKNNEPLFYDILCGDKQSTFAIAHKLDTTRYPIFRVKALILPEEEILRNDAILIMITDIEGSVSGMKGEENFSNYFVVFVRIIRNKQHIDAPMACYIPTPEKVEENFVIPCRVESSTGIAYDNFQLLPYYYNGNSLKPFEVIINDNIPVIDYDEVFTDEDDEDDDDYIQPIIRSESKFIQSSLLVLSLLYL